jgi:hypothetical protein
MPYAPLAIARDERGALFVWAGGELARWNGSAAPKDKSEALTREPLPSPVTGISAEPALRYVAAGDKLFERAGAAWKEIPMPDWRGAPLRARKVAARGDLLWVIADYDAGGCRRGSVVFCTGAGAPTLHCRSGRLATTPPELELRPVVVLGNNMKWSTLDVLAKLPAELGPHLRVARTLGRGFTKQLVVDTLDDATRARALAFAKGWSTSGFENPLCVDEGNLGPVTELPADWRTPSP